MAVKKERLDVRLVREGLCDSREKAKALIMSGNVYVGDGREDKAGTMVPEDKPVRIRENPLRYVSRGGLKLEKAISEFSLQLTGHVGSDAGASTGGFTDCMLQNGAKKVYAVDVGYGQLAWSLRSDDRVIVLEKTNVRFLTGEQVPELCDFASADLSFISLTKVLDSVASRLKPGARMVCLVKPQFEAGREKVGKKGVVRDAAVHEEVLLRVTDWVLEHGFSILGLTYSPVRGPEGNIEYLLYIEKGGGCDLLGRADAVREVVRISHEAI